MASVKIKVAGKSSKTEDKPAKRPAKRSSTTARKGVAPTKRAPRAKAKPAKSNNGAPVRRASKGIDPRTEARLLKLVEKAGDRRRKAEIEHKESINALHDAARDAIAQGVSMAKVADSSGISRQWLYKMGEFAEREGVTSGNGKPAVKSKPKAKPATRSTARKSTAKPAAKRPGKPARTRNAAKPAGKTRARIRSRA